MEGRYIIYGAGKQGRAYLGFLRSRGLDGRIIGFCDRRHSEIGAICGKEVFSYEAAREQGARFIIAVGDRAARDSICQMLEADGMRYCLMDGLAELEDMDRVAFNREFCAAFHTDSMEGYFEQAESEGAMEVFWGEGSEFFRLFSRLDLANVIELACGRGRHVARYIERAGNITLVDILEKNIRVCQDRFRGCEKIHYHQNDGYDLSELASGTYTALFSYDAVVHFEMMDIYSYLVDIWRVLVPGGKVLIHHSNDDGDYRSSFCDTEHGRSFMSSAIFAHLAYRAGFEVLEQRVIDWEGYADLDCITLLQKPIRI